MKRRTISVLMAAVVVITGLLTFATGQAEAANISRPATFACGTGYAEVYFPQLYSTNGLEQVYYRVDLFRQTATGWVLERKAPWYTAVVGQGGIYWSWGIYPNANGGASRIPFWNLPSGVYAVLGTFGAGTDHLLTVWGTTSVLCYVS